MDTAWATTKETPWAICVWHIEDAWRHLHEFACRWRAGCYRVCPPRAKRAMVRKARL